MSDQAAHKTFRLSERVSIDITVGPRWFVIQWDPRKPDQLTCLVIPATVK